MMDMTPNVLGMTTFHIFLLHVNESNDFPRGIDGQQKGEGPKHCIPKTQFNTHDGNKHSTYLVMLARIGLGSPTKSCKLQDSINRNGHNQEIEKLLNVALHTSALSLMSFHHHRLSPRNGRVWKNKGKSPLG